MLHIADRLQRSACGSTEGEVLPYVVWRWKDKKHTCKYCAETYRRRKLAFNILKLTGDNT